MDSKQVGFRLPVELLSLLDVYVERIAKERRGASYSRSDAVRELLYQSLERAGIELNAASKRK